MNDKTSIYSESYKVEPKDKSKVIAELRGKSAAVQRTQKLGVLLKEEKSTNQTLKRKVRTLEAEVRQLKEALALSTQKEQRRSRNGEPR